MTLTIEDSLRKLKEKQEKGLKRESLQYFVRNNSPIFPDAADPILRQEITRNFMVMDPKDIETVIKYIYKVLPQEESIEKFLFRTENQGWNSKYKKYFPYVRLNNLKDFETAVKEYMSKQDRDDLLTRAGIIGDKKTKTKRVKGKIAAKQVSKGTVYELDDGETLFAKRVDKSNLPIPEIHSPWSGERPRNLTQFAREVISEKYSDLDPKELKSRSASLSGKLKKDLVASEYIHSYAQGHITYHDVIEEYKDDLRQRAVEIRDGGKVITPFQIEKSKKEKPNS